MIFFKKNVGSSSRRDVFVLSACLLGLLINYCRVVTASDLTSSSMKHMNQ